jgi:hypothetical protein
MNFVLIVLKLCDEICLERNFASQRMITLIIEREREGERWNSGPVIADAETQCICKAPEIEVHHSLLFPNIFMLAAMYSGLVLNYTYYVTNLIITVPWTL